ncbi:MAG TPA: RluA family pseudouridine synthase [Saprospiraceae bacterium]|nr:RluA family pseudouridine synthase [Saprospiraceae bacterium]
MKKISELILYKDHHLLALNKPAGIPSQQDPTEDTSAHRMAMAYAHRDLYLVHRLDRRVSGVLLLAKTKPDAAHLAKQWESNKVKKIYYAVVPEKTMDQRGQLTHYLKFDSKQNITTTFDEKESGGEEAILHYEIVQHLENFMVMKIDLISGKKHQIRAQLAAIGCPVRGDIKYGSKRTNEDASIDLHAYSLQFQHPTKQQYIKIIAPFPEGGLWEHLEIKS